MNGLIVRKPWIDYILNGSKTWEIRGSKTNIRGSIELIQSGSGYVVGCCSIIDCKEITLDEFRNNIEKHKVEMVDRLPYNRTYAWILKDPIFYAVPREYNHPNGAIIWVKL